MDEFTINLQIAKFEGWNIRTGSNPKFIVMYDPFGKVKGSTDSLKLSDPNSLKSFWQYHIPQYCSDLHSILEVEKKLTKQLFATYIDSLAFITTDSKQYENNSRYSATSNQRARALVLAFGIHNIVLI